MAGEPVYFLGIDGGATRCRARLRDRAGAEIAEAEGPAANIYVDFDAAIAVVRETAARALADAGLDETAKGRIAVGLGLAGLSDAQDAARCETALPGWAILKAVNDATIACLGAHGGADGGLIISGTGSAAIARVAGRETIIGGRGFLLGDDGSAARMGADALRAAVRAADGLEPASDLSRALLAHFGGDPLRAIQWAREAKPNDYGAFAPLVLQAARSGEPGAGAIVAAATRAIEALADAVQAHGAKDIAIVGGLAAPLREHMPAELSARLREPLFDPADGAVLLAGGRLPAPPAPRQAPAPEPTLMRREIAESGAAAARLLGRNAEALEKLGERLRGREPALIVTNARGSSDHCALYLKYLAEIALGAPCASIGPSLASLYNAPLRLNGTPVVSISQSGRSPDIVAMQRAARAGGAFTLALVNEAASPLALEAELFLPLCAGPERSVAATKSMIAGLVASAALVAAWNRDEKLAAGLTALPDLLSAQTAPPPPAMIERLSRARSVFVIGRGSSLPMAAEAALKLKETCAIHAEAFSSAEVLHGPAGLVRPGFPVIAFLPRDAAREGVEETLRRLTAMGACVMRVDSGAADGEACLGASATEAPELAPILMIHRFYMLAEIVARRLGRDPDNPANLRKVTETR